MRCREQSKAVLTYLRKMSKRVTVLKYDETHLLSTQERRFKNTSPQLPGLPNLGIRFTRFALAVKTNKMVFTIKGSSTSRWELLRPKRLDFTLSLSDIYNNSNVNPLAVLRSNKSIQIKDIFPWNISEKHHKNHLNQPENNQSCVLKTSILLTTNNTFNRTDTTTWLKLGRETALMRETAAEQRFTSKALHQDLIRPKG